MSASVDVVMLSFAQAVANRQERRAFHSEISRDANERMHGFFTALESPKNRQLTGHLEILSF